MGFVAWLLGGGAPSQHLVDMVAVYFPAVAGALLVFPVFFIGRAIINRWAGLVAAGFIALMPGEFLVRTLLGNTDRHALDMLLATLFMCFLVLSAQNGKNPVPFNEAGQNQRKAVVSLVYAAIAGLCLGIYLQTWRGALLFIFISFAWLLLQFISDHLRGRSTHYLGITGMVIYGMALLVISTSPTDSMNMVSLAAAMLAVATLWSLAYIFKLVKINTSYYPAAALGTGLAAVAVLFFGNPQLLQRMFTEISRIFTWRVGSLIAEMQPLLINNGEFTLALAWGNYTTASILALVALAAVIYRAARKGEPEVVLLAVWSLISLLAALAMRRFAASLAINIALLAGYTVWLVLKLFGLGKQQTAKPTAAGKKNRADGKRAGQQKATPVGKPARIALGIIVIILLVVYPNTGPLPGGDKPFFDVATKALYAPSDAWCESLDWLRNNTPEPFGDAGYYYALYGTRKSGPAASYSTLCLWDYGYWVSRIGRRVPCSNPGSSDRGEWHYFMAQSAREADNVCAVWNVRYVIVNDHMINWNTSFTAMAGSAGESASGYYEIYYRQQKDSLVPTLLYYPEYYRTMAVRLYCFDGMQYEPKETAVISWEPRTAADGFAYKEISGLKTFRSYPEAEAFMSAQKTGNWRIVGKDPWASPVPLETLQGYRPAFASSRKAKTGNAEAPEVKIFEYNP
jgi:dolichyl-phosphooligosaccharide-protein glycotransferase